jgi:hypothetical protein
MVEIRTQLILRIEPFVLQSAVQAYLESDQRLGALGVVFGIPTNDDSAGRTPDRIIGLELKEPMLSFELSVDGLRRDFPYQGMHHLADQIAAACTPTASH